MKNHDIKWDIIEMLLPWYDAMTAGEIAIKAIKEFKNSEKPVFVYPVKVANNKVFEITFKRN